MKTLLWILGIGVLGFGAWWGWKNRYRIGLLKPITQAGVPETFIRKDKYGDVVWSKKDGVYTYTFEYGVVAGIPQKATAEEFMKAYKS